MFGHRRFEAKTISNDTKRKVINFLCLQRFGKAQKLAGIMNALSVQQGDEV